MEIQCLAQNLLPHDHQQQVPWLIVRKLATGAEEPKAVNPVPVRRLYSYYDYAVNEAGRAAVKDTGAAPGPVVDPAVVDPIDYASLPECCSGFRAIRDMSALHGTHYLSTVNLSSG